MLDLKKLYVGTVDLPPDPGERCEDRNRDQASDQIVLIVVREVLYVGQEVHGR